MRGVIGVFRCLFHKVSLRSLRDPFEASNPRPPHLFDKFGPQILSVLDRRDFHPCVSVGCAPRRVRMSRHGGLRSLRYRRADPAAKPRMLAACTRKPTNYFRVYKINERSVADGTRRVLSRSFPLPRWSAFTCEGHSERERERGEGTFLNVFLAAGVPAVFSATMARTCASVIDGATTVDRRQLRRVITVNWAVLRDTVITEETSIFGSVRLPPIFVNRRYTLRGERMKTECANKGIFQISMVLKIERDMRNSLERVFRKNIS